MEHDSLACWLKTGVIGVLAAWLASAAPARAATPQQVQQAIERGQKYLLAHRAADGTWEIAPAPKQVRAMDDSIFSAAYTQWGGYTALATYALLASGVDRRAEEMQKPIHFLLTANLQGTYALGLSSQIVTFLPEKETREFVKRNTAMLLMGMNQPPPSAINSPQLWGDIGGFYSYWVGSANGTDQPEAPRQLTPQKIGGPQPPGWFDRSNSQYAVLGMWALAEAGGEIPSRYWQIQDVAWKRAQLRDGGWNYNTRSQEYSVVRASMTAAGVATLFITQDYTTEENWAVCKGGIRNQPIERGLAWMDKNIETTLGDSLYTLYGIERIGTASGRKYFGTKDWYQLGADALVARQNADGSWNTTANLIPLVDTSFALLFLARGRAPVMMNKLEYEGDPKVNEPWDERPRDVANLAKWAGKQDESYYNWQVVNLRVAPEELHDAPILYIGGSQPLNFTAEEQAKLRTFAQEGGLILGNADCGREAFSRSFRELGHKLFPKYEWRQTAGNDFLFAEQFKEFRVKPRVFELTNNVRKLMVLIPDADASRAWQQHSSQSAPLFGLGANIFLYATDKKNLLTKGDTYWVTPNPAIKAVATLKVARLDVGDNPDPEPAGWARMNAILHNHYGLDLTTDVVKPEAVGGHDVAHLTGTGRFTLTPAQRSALKQFVAAGGTVIVDAAGGDVLFADSAENELRAIFNARPELLDETHLVFNYPGNRVDAVGFRGYAADKVVERRRAKLRGLSAGRRTAVFFSREDLSAGLVGEPVDGILGYDPATATALMEGMLLYAQSRGVPPQPSATAPATAAVQPTTTLPTSQPSFDK
ncbi:MAG TPA: DUF4159 domain-containing protein [Tepidisphaeraceae bacterium]